MRDKPKIWWLRYQCLSMLRNIVDTVVFRNIEVDTVEFRTIEELDDALVAIAADESGEYLLASCGERTQLPDETIRPVPRSWYRFQAKPIPRRVPKATDLEDSSRESEDLFAAYKNQVKRLDKIRTEAILAHRRREVLRYFFVVFCALAGATLFYWIMS